MELILSKNDLEEIIKNAFTGVKTIKFNTKNIKVTLDVDPNNFVQFKVKTGLVVKPNQLATTEADNIDPEAKVELERRKGLMISGGGERSILRVG